MDSHDGWHLGEHEERAVSAVNVLASALSPILNPPFRSNKDLQVSVKRAFTVIPFAPMLLFLLLFGVLSGAGASKTVRGLLPDAALCYLRRRRLSPHRRDGSQMRAFRHC